MRRIGTIAAKDFRSYLSSPGFYVVAGLFAVFIGFTFAMLLEYFAQSSQHFLASSQGRGEGLNLHNEVMVGFVSTINLVFIFLIPVLAIRQFSEERKSRAFDLLLTSPVLASDIVIGKFLAAFGAVMVLILLSLVYPLSLSLFLDIQWGSLLSSYLGLILMAGVYVSIGIFAASLTGSFFAAYGFAFIIILGSWFVSWGRIVVESSTWSAVVNHLAVGNHFEEFGKGQVQLAGVVFFLSLMVLYGFLSERVIESTRWR